MLGYGILLLLSIGGALGGEGGALGGGSGVLNDLAGSSTSSGRRDPLANSGCSPDCFRLDNNNSRQPTNKTHAVPS